MKANNNKHRVANKEDVIQTSERSFRYFKVPFEISINEAYELQQKLGYLPAKHGFYNFRSYNNSTTWMCNNL